ncbi:MAG TPA: hypothetical protein VLI55_08255 [Bryobacteraceae bacterium]|nr:hypothetical protein [Bryobacteraceae bacterium]
MSPTTVLWVVEIPRGSAHVNLETGAALLHVENICVLDAFTTANSVQGVNRAVNQVRGVINSLHIEWSGMIATETADEPVNQMRGSFIENTAKIAVTATTPRTMVTTLSNGHGFRFVSNDASTSVSNFALIGQEQNGIF